jgi:hypothetical protein
MPNKVEHILQSQISPIKEKRNLPIYLLTLFLQSMYCVRAFAECSVDRHKVLLSEVEGHASVSRYLHFTAAQQYSREVKERKHTDEN